MFFAVPPSDDKPSKRPSKEDSYSPLIKPLCIRYTDHCAATAVPLEVKIPRVCNALDIFRACFLGDDRDELSISVIGVNVAGHSTFTFRSKFSDHWG